MCVQAVAWPDPQIAAAIAAKYPGKRPRPLAVQVRDRLGEWLADEEFAAAFGIGEELTREKRRSEAARRAWAGRNVDLPPHR